MCRCVAELIVRPPRNIYDESVLPNTIFLGDGSHTRRIPVSFKNSRGQTIIGSFYPSPCAAPENPAVIYLHGNASNQFEGMWLVRPLCPQGVSVLTIDTTGCGCSDGEVIGLGFYERDDVAAAIDFLRSTHKIGPIVLWGRSMGAAISIWCASENMAIQGIVADSGYSSLNSIVEDIIGDRWWLWALVKVSLPLVNYYVKKLGGYGIPDVCIKGVEKAKCPALFVHGLGDDFIGLRESRELFAKYGGKQKYFMAVDGAHNDPRGEDVNITVLLFVLNIFDIEPDVDMLDMSVDDRSAQHFRNAAEMMVNTKYEVGVGKKE